MPITDFSPLLPLIVIVGTIVLNLLLAAFLESATVTYGITLAGLVLAFVALFIQPTLQGPTPLFIIDGFSLIYMGLMFVSTFAVTVLSRSYFANRKNLSRESEYYILLLLAALGSVSLVASNHFASFFLSLEILSVSLYVLIAYNRESKLGLEAGLKYLILAGSSSAFLLFGMALVYAALGTMQFNGIGAAIKSQPHTGLIPFVGIAMILVGVSFKLALAPFHMWSPDIYEGAPAPVSGFIATVSKGAMAALLLRYALNTDLHLYPGFVTILSLLAIASMFVGNFLALRQENVKRLLAYSSISHLGYILVAIIVSTPFGASAVTFYLIAYFVTNLAAFGVISEMSSAARDADSIMDYSGLFWERPFSAIVFTAALLSLAGLPLTAGFIGKFFLVSAGVGGDLWALIAVLVANSAIGLYYYLRVVAAMFVPNPARDSKEIMRKKFSKSGTALLSVLSCILIFLGVYPSPVLRLIDILRMSGF